MSTIPYKRIQLVKRMNYEESQRHCKNMKPRFKFGQLKLLVSEIFFLTRTSKGGETVVYAGSAPGNHIFVLAEMFPTLKFELWDGRDHEVEPHPNIQTNKGLFTNELSETYSERVKAGENILFISDIRNLDIGRVKKIKNYQEKMDEDLRIVGTDMKMQMEWCQIINPEWAFLKFRLPYKDGNTEYLTGKVYLQSYSPISTETRLLTNDYHTTQLYDNEENDEVMSYFNCNIRFNPLTDHTWDKVMDNNDIKKAWDNYICFYTLMYYLEKKHGSTPKDQEVADLFEYIINYHRKRYGSKYDYLYEN